MPSGVCVGAADLYVTRHRAAKEAWGGDIPTTSDYRTLLDRKDVDAVFVATSDHHHRRVTLDAIAAGKDVYCEKPMSHNVADGLAMVEAVAAGKRIFQAGSQRVSSILYKKAAEIYASGRWARCTRSMRISTATRRAGHGFIPLRRMPARRRSTGMLF